MTRMLASLFAFAALAFLGGCGQHESIKIGFISGQTGVFSDLGKGGLNGAIHAIEERNAKGGIGGRSITLLIGDDEQDPVQAKKALEELIHGGAMAAVGPMTSSIATELVPVANAAKIVLMGGTVVTDQLSGKDDYFFRAIAPTAYYATYSADVHQQYLKPRRVVVVFDAANRDYAENWARNYVAAFERMGGVSSTVIEIDSRQSLNLMALGMQIMASEPDLVTFATSARTAAGLMRSIRSKHDRVGFAVSAWAANHLLLELAGPAAEGALAEQYHEVSDLSPAYTRFAEGYRTRFQQWPDYAAVIAYDATRLVLDGLEIDPRREALKMTLLQKQQFAGLQGPIVLDQYGDASRQAHTARVVGGMYSPLK